MHGESILAMRNVHKAFPGVKALDGVDFSCRKAEAHALVGHNGAGKSTLIKILGGVYQADQGETFLNGQPFTPSDPTAATQAGISIIHQEFNLIPDLSVAQNIYLGREPKNRWGWLDQAAMKRGAAQALAQLEAPEISPDDYIRDLSVNQLQLVEIAKALSVNADIIVMDEPTAALPLPDVHKLFEIVAQLKSRGVTIIYISHRLEEIFAICDRVTLMKDGQMLATDEIGNLSRESLVEKMAGRSIVEFFPRHGQCAAERESALVLDGFRSQQMNHPISLEVCQGEIFGITGLEGCGASELAYGLFGADRRLEGSVSLLGKKLQIENPRQALFSGLGFVTKDRRQEGLVLISSLAENMGIPHRVKTGKSLGPLKLKEELKRVVEMVEKLDIKSGGLGSEAQYLSGGNQQKVILAKWLITQCKILVVDEPTRGVDVESKTQIYALLRQLADDGMVILIISSDIEEVLGLCDRIMVLHRGHITGVLNWDQATEQAVMLAATGCKIDSLGNALDDETGVCNM